MSINHMSDTIYTVVLIPDKDGGYAVEIPAVPEVISHGYTISEALGHATEAIELTLEASHKRGSQYPKTY